MTDDEKVVQILSKVIVNTVKNMMGDYDQTVAQKLKNIKISADNILPMSIDSTKIQKGSIQMADIANLEAKIAEIVQLDVKDIYIDTAHVRNLAAYVVDVAYGNIDEAKINWATIASAKIGTATVGQLFADQAEIKYLATDVSWEGSALIQKGVAEEFYMNRLAVNQAQIVDLMVDSAHINSLSVDKIKVKGTDGQWYKLVADEAGVVTEAVKLNGAYLKTDSVSGNTIIDGTLNGDDKIVGGSITAKSLAAHTITANEILAGTITANEIAANTITGNKIAAREITTNHLASSVGANLDLSSNQSIILRSAKAIDGMNLLLSTRESKQLEIGSGGFAYSGSYNASDAGNAIMNGNTTDTFTLSLKYVVNGDEGSTVTVIPFMYKVGDPMPRHGIKSGTQVNCGSSGTLSFTFTLSSALAAMIPAAFCIRVNGAAGTPFALSEMKLEKGDTATMYNYALEEGSETLDSQLSVMNDKIRADVTEQIERVTEDATEAAKSDLQAQMSLMGSAIEAKVSQTDYDNDQKLINDQFTEMQLSVDGVRTEVSDLEEKQASWFNMGTDGLEIGQRTYDEETDTWKSSDFTTLLSNTKLAFKQKDEEVAYISNLALMITQAAIKNTLSLGGLSGVLDGYAINWVFDDDAPLVRRNYFSGTATPNSITMVSGANYQYGSWISIVTAGRSLISGNQDDVFTVSYDYSLTNVPSGAPSFRIGMLFDSDEVGENVWPIRVSGGNNYSIIVADGSSEYSGKFETTFKLNAAQAAGTITQMCGYIQSDDDSTGWTPTLTISHLKLEKNNTPTTWVEALED